MKEENEKLYLEKKLFFDKKKAIDEIIKETDRKNTFFYRYRGEIFPMKLALSRKFFKKIENTPNFDMKKHWKSSSGTFSFYIYHVLFDNNKAYNYLLTTGYGKNPNSQYLLLFTTSGIRIGGGFEYYIMPELYARNKSIFKDLAEIPAINITSTLLSRFRTLLNDPGFSVSKIYGFKGLFHINQGISNNDIIVPEYNVSIKIKSPKKANDVFKNTFESTYNLLDNKTYSPQKTSTLSSGQRIKIIKENAPEKTESSELQGQSGYLKKLSEKVNLKSLTHAYENFFLYDVDNVIKSTFTIELQKEFSIYGLISFSGETKKNNKLELVSMRNKLKFEIIRDIYKKDMKFELSKVHSKKTFNVVGDHILNFSKLRTKK